MKTCPNSSGPPPNRLSPVYALEEIATEKTLALGEAMRQKLEFKGKPV
jgi:hypothetical protein